MIVDTLENISSYKDLSKDIQNPFKKNVEETKKTEVD